MLYAAPVNGEPLPPKPKRTRKKKEPVEAMPIVEEDQEEPVEEEPPVVEKVKKPRKQKQPVKKVVQEETTVPLEEPVAPPNTPEAEPLDMVCPPAPKSKRKRVIKDVTKPPDWFVTFIKNTKKQEASIKKEKPQAVEREPQTIANETWKNDYKRQRIEGQADQHMKQMHNLYSQMFYR